MFENAKQWNSEILNMYMKNGKPYRRNNTIKNCATR